MTESEAQVRALRAFNGTKRITHVRNYTVCPKKKRPLIEYSNTHNTEEKSLKITETHWHPFEHCVQVSSVSGSWYSLFAFSDTPKMQCSKTKLSVLNPMNSLQSNYGYKWCSKCPPSVFTLSRSRVRYR